MATMNNNNRKILISGASIAGPALAYWLNRYGFQPTVVEKAPALREGGYAIDIRGAAQEVAARMGILDEVRKVHTHRSEEHTSELQSLAYLVCRLLLEKKNKSLTLT